MHRKQGEIFQGITGGQSSLPDGHQSLSYLGLAVGDQRDGLQTTPHEQWLC